MSKLLAALALISVAAPLAALVSPQTDPMLERARRLLRDVPIIDGHNDYPWEVRQKVQGDVAKLDIQGPQPGLMTDIPRLKAGHVGAQFWSVYVPSPQPGTDPAASVTM